MSGSSLPTRLTFSTTPDGAVDPVAQITIDKDGNLLPERRDVLNCGDALHKWNLVRAITITSGDFVYENGVRTTEEGDGIAFYNPQGTKIAALDSQGNLHIKGKIIQDL